MIDVTYFNVYVKTPYFFFKKRSFLKLRKICPVSFFFLFFLFCFFSTLPRWHFSCNNAFGVYAFARKPN